MKTFKRIFVLFTICFVVNNQATAGARGPITYGPTGIEGNDSKNTIKVTNVHKGSPADGKLKKGDIIVGLNGKKFGKSPKQVLQDRQFSV